MSVKDRLKKFIAYKGVSVRKFEGMVGMSYGYVNNMRVSMQPDKVMNIASVFPELNTGWLLTGDGSMLKSTNDAKPVNDVEFVSVPMVPIHAYAGYSRGYGDLEYIDTLPTVPVITDRTFKGKYRVFEVDGDSMDNGMRDSFIDKDRILCREVMPGYWSSKLHIRDWFFVIVCKNDGIFVKQISNHDVERGIITCHSLNPMYEDFDVDLRDVAEIYNVIKIVDRSARL